MRATLLSLLLLIGFIIWFSIRTMKTSKIQMKKKWTYLFLITYAAILLIATFTVEILHKKHASEQPAIVSQEKLDLVHNAVTNGTLETVDPSQVIDKRTHTIGNILAISSQSEDSYPYITIERKKVNDGLIEETIFKPQLIVDEFDLSDEIKYALPQWSDDQLTFNIPPLSEIKLSLYDDAFLLKQFTSTSRELFGYSHSAMLSEITVHLLVPKDLTIKIDEHLNVDYIKQ